MRRNISILIMFLLLGVMISDSFAAQKFNAQTLRKMSTFISNFTESNNFNFNVQQELMAKNYNFFVDFAVKHNIINYSKSRIVYKKDEGVLEGKWVTQTVEKYFDYELLEHTQTEIYDFDADKYYFPRTAVRDRLYAVVNEAKFISKNIIEMKGFIYNPKTKKRSGQTFVALAKPHTFNKVKTWAILSLYTKHASR